MMSGWCRSRASPDRESANCGPGSSRPWRFEKAGRKPYNPADPLLRRHMRTPKLFTPGPTAVPAEVLETQARPLIHHRTEEFRQALTASMRGLQYVLETTNPVVILTASGSGAMEATVVNLTRPGETVIVTEVGKFSERWREIAEVFGVNVVAIRTEYGDIASPESVERAFKENPGATVLFTTHSETSTGALQDVEAFARIAKKNKALIAVDAITSA